MLYILPPPSAKPPSVWDLIINFHRKEAASSSHPVKKSLKFDCRETKKSQRTWCRTSPSEPSHVRVTLMTSKHDQFHFLAALRAIVVRNQTMDAIFIRRFSNSKSKTRHAEFSLSGAGRVNVVAGSENLASAHMAKSSKRSAI